MRATLHSGRGAAAPLIAALVILAAPALASGATPHGTLELQVVLRPRDPLALSAFVAAVSTPGSPLAGHYLRRGQFAARFGASAKTIAAVSARLRAEGLTVDASSADRLSIPVRGAAATVERAFSVRLAGTRLGYESNRAAHLPGALAGAVQDVVGLSDVPIDHPAATAPTPAPPSACPAASSVSPSNQGAHDNGMAGDVYLTDDRIAAAYGIDPLYAAGDFGQGVKIGVFEEEPSDAGEVTTYEQCFGIDAPVSYENVDGGPSGVSSDGGMETALDVETVASFAPRASIVVYQTNQDPASALDQYRQMVSDDTVSVITTSWGACNQQTVSQAGGTGYLTAENTVFQEAAAQGQTVLASADDNGAEDCAVNLGGAEPSPLPFQAVEDPADQPDVTGVGGTRLTLSTTNTRVAETVWNDSYGSSGGGPSPYWTMPSWQYSTLSARGWLPGSADAGPAICPSPLNSASNGYCREVPDVTADGDPSTGYVIYWADTWTHVGGTSGAGPLWAGLTALADSCRASAGRGPLGLMNPTLYSIAASAGTYSQAFFDVTQGNDDWLSGAPGGFTAGPGYDMASGLGAPIAGTGATGVVDQLCGGAPAAPGAATKPTPLSQSCPGRSPLVFALSQAAGRVTSVRVYVGKRLVRSVRGRRIARVRVARPAARSYTLTLVIRTARGKTRRSVRRVADCREKR
ncbi:MAG TPA: S53 family peptidase [Solirubrobacteraceae bacterium]|jgi:subtilase family serine protease|nr:S53 family peptidase [Solirubrobacteraceae bacterium]